MWHWHPPAPKELRWKWIWTFSMCTCHGRTLAFQQSCRFWSALKLPRILYQTFLFSLSALLTDAPKLCQTRCTAAVHVSQTIFNDLAVQTKATSYSLSMPSCQSFWALQWTQFGLTLTPSSCRPAATRRILRCPDFTVRSAGPAPAGPARIHPLPLGRRARIQEKCCRGVPEHLGSVLFGHCDGSSCSLRHLSEEVVQVPGEISSLLRRCTPKGCSFPLRSKRDEIHSLGFGYFISSWAYGPWRMKVRFGSFLFQNASDICNLSKICDKRQVQQNSGKIHLLFVQERKCSVKITVLPFGFWLNWERDGVSMEFVVFSRQAHLDSTLAAWARNLLKDDWNWSRLKLIWARSQP